MQKPLIIVESPKKVITIQNFLPKNWTVRASYGYVRQLAKDAYRRTYRLVSAL